jgi:sugar/nucleoside kinase (ribokinase family)
MSGRVVCVGDVMVDVLTRLAAPLQIGSDTPAEVTWTGGGSAANTAAWLASEGVEAVFAGRVGADVPGQVSVDALNGCGVTTAVAVDPVLPTGTCVVVVDQSGERTMIPSPGANAALTDNDVDAVRIGAGDHLHVSGYALFGGARAAALHAMTVARAAGCTISVGAASAAPLRAVGGAEFQAWAAGTTVFANRDEAAILVGAADPAAEARAIATVAGTAIVTAGAEGATWSDGTDVVHVPSVPIGQLADSTGAGDAFAAGYLAALLGGVAVAEALHNGCVLAARACLSIGARPVSGGR